MDVFHKTSSLMKACGTLALDNMTRALVSRQAARANFELKLKMAFPKDWNILLETMDSFDRASAINVSVYVMQMWACGVCRIEELLALYEGCPYAFKDHDILALVDKPAPEILPLLAKNLP